MRPKRSFPLHKAREKTESKQVMHARIEEIWAILILALSPILSCNLSECQLY
jgi:hypothetical protein